MTPDPVSLWARSVEATAPLRKAAAAELERSHLGYGYGPLDDSWHLPGQRFPMSLTDEEGILLHALVSGYQLDSAYEIATAFGYSTAYIALALQSVRRDARCDTLDCYVEESANTDGYSQQEMRELSLKSRELIRTGGLPLGLRTAKKLSEATGCASLVNYHAGLSPDDVGAVLKDRPIHFAFIDGGHFQDQPTLDFKAVLPHLGERAIVAFHDNVTDSSVHRAVKLCAAELGGETIKFRSRFRLTAVLKNVDPKLATGLHTQLYRRRQLLRRGWYFVRSRLAALKPATRAQD